MQCTFRSAPEVGKTGQLRKKTVLSEWLFAFLCEAVFFFKNVPLPQVKNRVLKFKNMVDPEFGDVLNFKHVALPDLKIAFFYQVTR